MTTQDIDNDRGQASVEELEKAVKGNPDNVETKLTLLDALIHRHAFEGGTTTDIDRLRQVISTLPKDRGYYARAYLAWIDGNHETAAGWLREAMLSVPEDDAQPLDSGKLLGWIVPFVGDSVGTLYTAMADAFSARWPDSAPVLTLRGLVQTEENNFPQAIDCFASALNRDETFWLAAWMCADTYAAQKNWRAAKGYYRLALKHAGDDPVKPVIYSDLAWWCLGRIKDYRGEEEAYRECLKLEPDYPDARNNLGWSLMRQRRYDEAEIVFRECLKLKPDYPSARNYLGLSLMRQRRYEEAEAVFREAIERGNDGKYPLRNLAWALEKLGRYPEAIEIAKKDLYREKLTKSAEERIQKLKSLIEKQQQGDLLPEDNEVEQDELDIEIAVSDQESDELTIADREESEQAKPQKTSRVTAKRLRTSVRRIHTEKTLEQLIEEKLQRDQEAFGCRMRVYESPEGMYGRQFAIPEIGRIDLLAENLETNDFVVIELKRDQAEDQVVGQTARYMGWVRENLATDGQNVLGIICVGKVTEKLRLAAASFPGVDVFEYDLVFRRI